jgi:GTP cyclohydrolase I
MKDTQNQRDYRNIPIDKVGIKNLRYPITVRDRRDGSEILEDMKKHLNAASAHIEVTFPYFIEKRAPVSASPGLMDYTCRIVGTSDPSGKIDLVSEVIVPISSVCPCSLEISDHGAHNQRGEVQLATRFKKFIWMEDMIDLVEAAASTDVYSVLKRMDEKRITETAFSNPKFVEDIVRDIAKKLEEDDNITWFSVSAENFESIHNHRSVPRISNPSTITVPTPISPAINNFAPQVLHARHMNIFQSLSFFF